MNYETCYLVDDFLRRLIAHTPRKKNGDGTMLQPNEIFCRLRKTDKPPPWVVTRNYLFTGLAGENFAMKICRMHASSCWLCVFVLHGSCKVHSSLRAGLFANERKTRPSARVHVLALFPDSTLLLLPWPVMSPSSQLVLKICMAT